MSVASRGAIALPDATGARLAFSVDCPLVANRRGNLGGAAGGFFAEYQPGLGRQGASNGIAVSGRLTFEGNGGKGAGSWVISALGGSPTLGLNPGAALAAPNDFYCEFGPVLRAQRPLYGYRDAWAIWEVGAYLGIGPVTGAIARSCGVELMAECGVTGYPYGLLGSGGGVGAPWYPGIGVGFTGAAGQLNFYARNNNTAFALSENVALGIYPPGALIKLAIRIYQAQRDSDAFLRVYVNDQLLLSRGWGAGSTLPTQTSFPTWPLALKPYWRQDSDAVNGAVLHFGRAWVAAGPDNGAFY